MTQIVLELVNVVFPTRNLLCDTWFSFTTDCNLPKAKPTNDELGCSNVQLKDQDSSPPVVEVSL